MVVIRVFRYAARLVSGVLDYKALIDSYVFLSFVQVNDKYHCLCVMRLNK